MVVQWQSPTHPGFRIFPSLPCSRWVSARSRICGGGRAWDQIWRRSSLGRWGKRLKVWRCVVFSMFTSFVIDSDFLKSIEWNLNLEGALILAGKRGRRDGGKEGSARGNRPWMPKRGVDASRVTLLVFLT